ncbi:MAG TPA: hypothetical protein PLD48_02170 [Bacillota bacterium]|nr:hypothetical protein [Bacillota bacterium]HOK68147.1 hypothetical protein [Bacillota bacterium]HPP84449.1 hypothetical protein [Bacillota bacterium]
MKQKMTNQQILDAIFDLADEKNMTVDELLAQLQADFESGLSKSREGLPEEIIAELENARKLRKESRIAKRQSEQNEQIRREAKRFREVFPDVSPQDIPDSVWDAVAEGIPLLYAYALYKITEKLNSDYAGKVNDENSARAAVKFGDGETEPSFTKEQVEAMSPKEIAKNYKGILKSFSKWKY